VALVLVAAEPLPEVLGSALLSLLVVGYLARLVQYRRSTEHDYSHDEVTGLPNRFLFDRHLSLALAHAAAGGRGPAVMVLDLDRFKNINAGLGHVAGNRLLDAVGQRLIECVPSGGIVARLGGDEFAVLLPDAGGVDGVTAAAYRLLETFRSPLRVLGRRIFVTPSVGLAMFPSHGWDAEELLKHADTAMSSARAQGGNTFRLYSPDMSESVERRLMLEAGLHTAIERNELVVHYQPVVDLTTGRTVGTEALLRWDHPQLGLLPPDAFIPLAEETGLIVSLGEWTLETACAQVRQWQLATGSPMTVAVNLSARQLQQEGLDHLVAGVLERTGLDPACLELEITESLALQDPEANTRTLADLRDIGVGCSLDDFGTGYCGLSYLARFPATKLKIDRSFVQKIGGGGAGASLVLGVIQLAHSLGLQVIAEGIETGEQLDFLRAHGCEEGQGYLFGRPLPPERIVELLDLGSGASEEALSLTASRPAA
jgi:diguanylate cyclase (GGDEF)-like protein